MIFAKISPAASAVRQNGPFNTTVVTGEWMTASTRDYALNSSEVSFRVSFGTVELEDGKVVNFDEVIGTEVTLTETDLVDWGTDDSVILTKIASKLDIKVLEVVEGSVKNGRLRRF